LLGELSYELDLEDLYDLGLPRLPMSSFPPCGSWPTCNRTQLFEGLAKLPPSFPPFATPAYSDIGFVLLSFVAERVAGKSFETLLTESVLKPLNLTHTFLHTPDPSLGIVPGVKGANSWRYDMAEEAP
jgi:CubicO group peptidase (beta-lactamase class C family)